ncbi:MAG: hypothetical protein HYV27_18470 [Candidatus Hydrogenedentes bacterium]|nr:hypothetical protein [Candidatus Hydrogenedentota bacterium]
MTEKQESPVFLLRTQRTNTVEYSAISTESYKTLFDAIPDLPKRLHFREPLKITLSKDIVPFVNALTDVVSGLPENPRRCLIVEFLDRNVDVDIYDDFTNAIALALNIERASLPFCIVLAVSHPAVFKESVFFQRRLRPLCQKKMITLLLVCDNPTNKPELLVTCDPASVSTALPSLEAIRLTPEPTPNRISTDEIRMLVQVLNGHFELSVAEKPSHFTGIIDVRALASNHIFIEQLREEITEHFSDPSFQVLPVGMPLGGLRELGIALVDGNAKSLIARSELAHTRGRKVVVLCDLLAPCYLLQDIVTGLHQAGAVEVIVYAVARTLTECELGDTKIFNCIDLPISIHEQNDPTCIYCTQSVETIKGECYDDFAHSIGKYDPVCFWQLISQDERFYQVGHWASDRTPNHYHFRVLTKPIFEVYSKDIGLRVRNCLLKQGVLPNWVRRIVIPDEPEARLLGNAIAVALGLSSTDVISIPRGLLLTVAGASIDKSLIEYVTLNYNQDESKNLQFRNVLIVDQAAHHFKTLSALRSVCEHFNATILSFIAFLDRTDLEMSIGEFAHDSHYVSLYSWSSPPRRSYECPCRKL